MYTSIRHDDNNRNFPLRKKSEAVSEALGYLQRIIKYGFYSSGKALSGGSDPGSPKRTAGKDEDIDTRMKYPEKEPKDVKRNPKAEPVPEEKMDPEREEELEERYGDMMEL